MVVGQMRYAVALTMTGLSALSLFLAAGLLFVLSAGPQSRGYWFAAGMGVYAVAIGLHGSLFIVRLFRRARLRAEAAAAAGNGPQAYCFGRRSTAVSNSLMRARSSFSAASFAASAAATFCP